MLPEAQLSNYHRSFVAYVEANYTLTEKFFPDVQQIDTEPLTEWVEFIWASNTPFSFVRHTDNAHPGNIVDATIGAIIRVKPTSVEGRILVIRDVVVDLLRRPLIEVRNWMGTKEIIGTLQGEGLINDVNLNTRNDLSQWSLGFRMRYQEKFERVRS